MIGTVMMIARSRLPCIESFDEGMVWCWLGLALTVAAIIKILVPAKLGGLTCIVGNTSVFGVDLNGK